MSFPICLPLNQANATETRLFGARSLPTPIPVGNPIVKREETIPGPLLDRMEVIRLTGAKGVAYMFSRVVLVKTSMIKAFGLRSWQLCGRVFWGHEGNGTRATTESSFGLSVTV